MKNILKNDEKVVFALRELYGKYGYTPYKMNKFEEYDLYAKNKDFLVSANVITFTDTNGKLMALKPDVTLSIIKNGDDDENCLSKVYYNENVYRVSGSTRAFREIMQAGIECVGAVDTYAVIEVLSLAAESLISISEDCVLDISSLDVISEAVSALGISDEAQNDVMRCIGEKNTHELIAVCEKEGADKSAQMLLSRLIATYGKIADVLPEFSELCAEYPEKTALFEFCELAKTLSELKIAGKMNLDLSVVGDMAYYNGIVFRGFVKGIPTGVLSGGQYDRLMQKLGKRSRAIGFAVYLDLVEELDTVSEAYDVDVILLYDKNDSPMAIKAAVDKLTADGKSVSVQKCIPEKLRARRIVKLSEVTK